MKLFESLLKSEKFIQTLSGEFIITSELIDDNVIFDWSDLSLPYIYEKIALNYINNILDFKEILLLEYASIIGTIFDLKTFDKLNPLKSIIKINDLEKILLKLKNEYIAEIFTEEIENQKKKRLNLICHMTFPLMREVLHQKFLMEKRAALHMKVAKLISTSKKSLFFSIENELKILKRHLLYSEMNIINEIELKEIRTVQDILQNKKVLNYNNLKLFYVKEIFSKYYSNYKGNIMEGNLEMLINGSRWIKVSYFIDNAAKMFISLRNPKTIINEYIMIINIKDIYKNKFIKNDAINTKNDNLFAIYIFKETADNKKIVIFSSDQREEICKLDITLNFLKVKVNYDKYVNKYGFSQFPLYKSKWFKQKNLFYFDNLEQNCTDIRNVNTMSSIFNLKKLNSSVSEAFITKVFNKTKIIKKSFNIIIQGTFSLFLGIIQEKLVLKKRNENKEENSVINYLKEYNYLYSFSTPKHIGKRINEYIKSSKDIIDSVNQEIKIITKPSLRESLLPRSNYSYLNGLYNADAIIHKISISSFKNTYNIQKRKSEEKQNNIKNLETIIFSPELLRMPSKEYNQESMDFSSMSKNSNDQFKKVQEITQIVEDDDISISDFDIDEDIIININNIKNDVVHSLN
jgi:hypothetical protein